MYQALDLGDVFAVIAFYHAHSTELDEYLRRCEEEADAIRRKLEASQPLGPRKGELLALWRASSHYGQG